jgi:ankyrin repeat protein
MVGILVAVAVVCVGNILLTHFQARASLKSDPVGALLEAAIKGDVWTLTYLLDHGVDVNASPASAPGATALHGAVMSDSRDCVELLIHRGANLEAHPTPDVEGDLDTPLAHAVSMACDSVAQKDGMPGEEPTHIVELLLAAGADPQPGLTALRPYQGLDEQTPLANLLRAALQRRRG